MPLSVSPSLKQEELTEEQIREISRITREVIQERFRDIDPEDLAAAIEEIQDTLLAAVPLIRRRVLEAFSSIDIDIETLTNAIRRIDDVNARLVFEPVLEKIRRDLTGDRPLSLIPPLQDAAESGRQIGAGLIVQIGLQAEFDAPDPLLVEWIEQHTAKLVRQVTDETRMAIRDVIRRAFVDGATPAQAARPIREILRPDQLDDYIVNKVGLTRRQARAVDRFFQAQIDEGVSRNIAIRRANNYSKRLLRLRAETIARTEILKAAHQGTQMAWEQGIRDGFIRPRFVKKMWLTAADDRVCPICAPMDGTIVEIREEFGIDIRYSDESEVVETINEVQPPAHPNCRCNTVLVTV